MFSFDHCSCPKSKMIKIYIMDPSASACLPEVATTSRFQEVADQTKKVGAGPHHHLQGCRFWLWCHQKFVTQWIIELGGLIFLNCSGLSGTGIHSRFYVSPLPPVVTLYQCASGKTVHCTGTGVAYKFVIQQCHRVVSSVFRRPVP